MVQQTTTSGGQEKRKGLSKTLDAFVDSGVSKNRGAPKWMVYNGKPY